MTRRLLAALVALPATALATDDGGPGPGWTQANRNPEIAIYTRDGHAGAREVYAVAELDADPADVFAVLIDYERYTEFMPYTAETTVLERSDASHLAVYQRITPPLVDPRDYVMEVSLSLPASGQDAYTSHWSSTPDAVPQRDGCVRVRVNSGSWSAEPLPDGRTRLVHRLQTHPGGSIPTWVANRSNTIVIPEMFRAIRRRVAQVAGRAS